MSIFSKHPKGLGLLFFTEMAERFSYYGMRSLFALYLVAVFFSYETSSEIYGSYSGLVYLTPLLGGWLASRYWGTRRSVIVGSVVMAAGQFLLFLSACTVKQSIFFDPDLGGVIDPNVDNTLAMWLMFAGLAALIVGNGFFKPNLASMVGDLYPSEEIANDSRRDAAYTIYYMGVNIGAFLAPLVCGFVSSDGDWSNPGAFKWAFLSAAIAMLLGLIVFVALKDKMLISPDGKQLGLPPKQVPKESLNGSDNSGSKSSPAMLGMCLILGLALAVVFSVNANSIEDYITAVVYASSIAFPLYIITGKGLTTGERMRIGVIYIVALFVVFFWAAYEQAGTSLTFFADRQCDRHIGRWEMPTPWFQSINPIAIVLLAPVMAVVWEMLAKFKVEPSAPVKQAMGLLLLAIGYAIIAFGAKDLAEQPRISMWWLIALYLIHTVAELTLSPIGQSMVYKLSPTRIVSLIMGVWFMSSAASNVLAGSLATLMPNPAKPGVVKHFLGIEITSFTDFFLLFAVMAGIAAIALFMLCPLLNKMMKEDPVTDSSNAN